ncbi:MAG TPA: Ig-like domain-containing protein [Prosthecobacter sp.]
MRFRYSFIWPLICLGSVLLLLGRGELKAAPEFLGDLDENGIFTAHDLAKLAGHSAGLAPLSQTLQPYADLNQDGVINDIDQDELVKLILETAAPRSLPLARVRSTSPGDGTGAVAVTRETIFTFSLPLALDATLDTTQFYAEFGGRKILSRVEISADRRKATLFYLEPLPSNARVRVTLAPTALTDLIGRTIDTDGDGVAGGTYQISFDTLSITGLSGTGITGRVLASEKDGNGADVPLAGVTVTVDGAEETLRTTTNASGQFVLSPCPAGSFFVHVDGRTASVSDYPAGNYYPNVGKRWEARAGRMDNLSGNSEDTARGTIYLPKILAGSLHAVSQTEQTPVEFPPAVLQQYPELQGTEVIVPPNSLFADDGTRGGQLGIAPVDSGRLPSPLPPGLELPMVITIQTDGASNFDIPVPVTFPNLPDPVTGHKLPPGAKSALWSFNHDIGDWEVVGPMTVTEDGNFLKTDAGVGVLQPGWHGAQGGAQGRGTPPRKAPPKDKPPCVKRSAWEWATLTLDVAKEATLCAAEFSKIKDALKCGIALGDLLRTTLVNASTINDSIAKGESLEAIENALGVLDAQLGAADGLLNCYNSASPVQKATAIFECVGNALTIADSVCQFADDPSATPNCRAGAGSRTLCTGIYATRVLHNELKMYLDLVKGLEERAALASITYTVKKAKLLVEETRRARANNPGGGAQPPPPAGGTQLTDAERAKLRAVFGELQEALNQGVKATSNLEKMAKSVEKLQQSTDEMVSTAAQDIKAWGEPVQSTHYYRLQAGQVVRRGRTTSAGASDFIMPPDERYELSMYDAANKEIGTSVGATGANGASHELNAMVFRSVTSLGLPDTDNDGLVDEAEKIIGTLPNLPDSDNDGILDGAEVEQGTDPLGGFIAQTGIIATAPTSGPAVDVATSNNYAVTANGAAGINVFNIVSGLNPTRMADVDTPGTAVAVAMDGAWVAVADASHGLALVSLANSADVRIVHQVAIEGGVKAVFVAGTVAYAGTESGKVVAVDMPSGLVLDEATLPAASGGIQDLAVWRDFVYVLQVGKLTTLDAGSFTSLSSLNLDGVVGAGGRRFRLFAGEGTLYATHTQGFNIVDTQTNPSSPVLVQHFVTGQFGWKHVVSNGSGQGIAAVSPNSTDDGEHNVELYTLGANGRLPAFGSLFDTPGLAAAVSIYNGLAYVADTSSGLQVLSYLAFDSQGQAPTITLSSNIELDTQSLTGQIEEGKLLRVSSLVTDDVQIRNVEYHVDGKLVQLDGNYPFEFRTFSPVIRPGKNSFTLQAKAVDTGGNTRLSPLYTITLVPDIIPPQVTRVRPRNLAGNVTTIIGWFNEPLTADTVTASSFVLSSSGPDAQLGTADDVQVAASLISYREDIQAASMEFAERLPAGKYRAKLTTDIKDAAGNALAADYTWDIQVDNEKVYWVGSGSGRWNDPESWSTGQLPGYGQSVVVDIPAGATLDLAGQDIQVSSITVTGGGSLIIGTNQYATLRGVTLNADITIGRSAVLTVYGALTLNNSKIIMDTPGSYSSGLYFYSDGRLTGTGEVVQNGPGYAYVYGGYAASFGPGITTRVNGEFSISGYDATMPIVLQGPFINDSAAARLRLYSCKHEGTADVSKGSLILSYGTVNLGTYNLSGAGTLAVDNSSGTRWSDLGTINRSGGTAEIWGLLDLKGTTWALNATTGDWLLRGGKVLGGSITTADGAKLVIAANYEGTLEDIRLQGQVLAPATAVLTLRGEWINDGTISLTNATLNLYGEFKIDELGTINRTGSNIYIMGVLDNTGRTLAWDALPDSVSVGYNGTIKGGTVGGAGGTVAQVPVNTYANLDGVTVQGGLAFGTGSNIYVENGLTLNNAVIKPGAGADGYYNITFQFSGIQTVGGTGEFRFNEAGSYQLGMRSYGSYVNGNYVNGRVTLASGITVKPGRSSYMDGTYSGEFINEGNITVEGAESHFAIFGKFTNAGSATVSAGRLILRGDYDQPWKNTGTLNVSGTGSLALGSLFTQADLGVLNRTGGQVDIIGTLDNTGQTLALNATTGSWNLGDPASGSTGAIKGGTVTTSGGAILQVVPLAQGTLENVVLQGSLNYSGATLSLLGDWVNSGTISGNNGHLVLGGEFKLSELGVINRTGGTVKFTGILDNTGNTLVMDSQPDTLKFGYGGTVKGGTLMSADGSLGVPDYNSISLDAVTLASSVQASRLSIVVKNGLTLNSVNLTLENAGLSFSGTQTLGGSGQIIFSSLWSSGSIYTSSPELPDAPPTVLTLGSGITVRGGNGSLDAGWQMSIINQGTIQADVADRVIHIYGTFVNQGQLVELNGGDIVLH